VSARHKNQLPPFFLVAQYKDTSVGSSFALDVGAGIYSARLFTAHRASFFFLFPPPLRPPGRGADGLPATLPW